MENNNIQANQCERRSFVYRKLEALSATWSETNDYAYAALIHDAASETDYAQQLALCDMSHLQRVGFKGAGTIEWLTHQQVHIPPEINSAAISVNGSLISRLGSSDILIIDNLKNPTDIPQKLAQQWQQDYAPDKDPCGFIMPRQDSHACFCVSGINAPEMFATLCAVDLRVHKFSNYMIAQTSLARIGAIIIRADLGTLNNYFVLVENVAAEYCWDCLQDAMLALSGHVIGASTLVNFSD